MDKDSLEKPNPQQSMKHIPRVPTLGGMEGKEQDDI